MSEDSFESILMPSSIWGDFNVPGWSRKDNNLLTYKLLGISTAIIYADQAVINRVIDYIREVITKAKSGELPPQEVFALVEKKAVFSEQELEVIDRNVENQAEMMEKFFKSSNSVN